MLCPKRVRKSVTQIGQENALPKRVRESCPGSCGVPLSVRASSAYVSRCFFLFFIFSNYSYSPACAGRSRPTLEPLFRFALVAVRSAGIKALILIAERSRGVLIANLITLKSRWNHVEITLKSVWLLKSRWNHVEITCDFPMISLITPQSHHNHTTTDSPNAHRNKCVVRWNCKMVGTCL